MKKWHLEGVIHGTTPKKFLIPDPGRTAPFLHTSPAGIRKEHTVKICCRQVAAFFIRFL